MLGLGLKSIQSVMLTEITVNQKNVKSTGVHDGWGWKSSWGGPDFKLDFPFKSDQNCQSLSLGWFLGGWGGLGGLNVLPAILQAYILLINLN